MNRPSLAFFARWLLLITFALPTLAHAGGEEFVPRQALVRFAPGTDVAAFNAQYGTQSLRIIAGRNIHQLLLPLNADEQAFEQTLDLDPRVLSADLNFFGQDVDPTGSTQTFFLASSSGAFQNDPTPGLLGVPQALPISTGRGVIVAVIDSGIDSTHPLFAGRIAPGGFNFLDDTTNLADVGPGPLRGHGTLVAGLVLRVAPEATILPIRVLDSFGQTTTFALAQGIYHAIDRGAQVINISLGTTADPDLLKAAVSEAHARGIIIVAAAGNDDASSPPRSPAGLASLGVIAVASTDAQRVRSEFSNFGAWVTIAAPGQGAIGPVPGGGFGTAQGTSFASPLVAGVAALLRSIGPLTPAEVIREQIRTTATNIDAQNPSFVEQLGAGWVNAAAALAAGGPPLPWTCDLDRDRRLTIEDLYRAFVSPTDLNADGVVTLADQLAFEAWLRARSTP
ncbi:MAG: S8 family serine peptidase [Phycisphaerales bacterium]|nr:S8 family serine peptidase [Phycisphaerales bacterium]